MKVEIKGNELCITIPMAKRLSNSGKTYLVASTGGNTKTGILFEGKEISLGLNAYISK